VCIFSPSKTSKDSVSSVRERERATENYKRKRKEKKKREIAGCMV
jgi:hypothetical protein